MQLLSLTVMLKKKIEPKGHFRKNEVQMEMISDTESENEPMKPQNLDEEDDDDEDDDYDSAPAPIKPLSKARSDGRRVSSRRPGAGSVGSGRGSDTDGVTSDAGHTSDARSDVASVAGSGCEWSILG